MFIPDPNFFYPRSRIQAQKDSRSRIRLRIKEYFFPKNCFFLSSRKYEHPGSRIRILSFYPSQSPDPGVKKAPNPGSGSATLFKSLLRAGVKHAVSTTAQLVSANDFTQLRGLLSRAELRRLKKEVP
jgi:hypothetical protein